MNRQAIGSFKQETHTLEWSVENTVDRIQYYGLKVSRAKLIPEKREQDTCEVTFQTQGRLVLF